MAGVSMPWRRGRGVVLAPRPNALLLDGHPAVHLVDGEVWGDVAQNEILPGVENVYSNDEVAGGEFGALSASRLVASLMNRFGGKPAP